MTIVRLSFLMYPSNTLRNNAYSVVESCLTSLSLPAQVRVLGERRRALRVRRAGRRRQHTHAHRARLLRKQDQVTSTITVCEMTL